MSDKSSIEREAYLLAAEKILRERLGLPLTSVAKEASSSEDPPSVVAVDKQTRDRWGREVRDFLLRQHPEQDFIYKTSGDSMVFAHLSEDDQSLRVWDMEIRSEETIDLSHHFFARRYRGQR